MHEGLGITPPQETKGPRYHARPYLVIHADRFARALDAAIKDPDVGKACAAFGSVDQFVDSTDVLARPAVYARLRTLYEETARPDRPAPGRWD